MNVPENALTISGPAFEMLGIVSQPPSGVAALGTGVVIVVGGAQYRAGSHRQFVQLARFLAAAGYTVLRFDLPGMGDSPGPLPSFEDVTPHVGAAINALQGQCPGMDRIVLWGLCDGASASLLYVQSTRDARVAGLALLNPWLRSESTLARVRVKHYYRERLMDAEFWRKLLAGGVGWQALKDLGHTLRRMRSSTHKPAAESLSFQDRMALAWQTFPGTILLLLSGQDLTAREFTEYASTQPRWAGWTQRPRLVQHPLDQADHTCSTPGAAREAEVRVLDWLRASEL